VSAALAPAKLNLALVVGPRRADGYHELLTVYERLQLADRLELAPAERLTVDGFPEDTLVRGALELLAAAAGVEPRWRVTIEKEIPVAAGLAGGSSDAAAALGLANATLPEPLPETRLHKLAERVGADVPFFLRPGAHLGQGRGTELEPLELPRDYAVLLWLPDGAAKTSTGDVFAAFEARSGSTGFGERCTALADALARVRTPRDLAAFPPNDLVRDERGEELRGLGAFRADVTGAGPTLYGLFDGAEAAQHALEALSGRGRLWLTAPC